MNKFKKGRFNKFNSVSGTELKIERYFDDIK